MGYNPGSAGGGGGGQGIGGYGTGNQIYLDAIFGRDTGKSLSSAFNPANAFLTLDAAFQFVTDNDLDGTSVIMRDGNYPGASIVIPGDSLVGNPLIAEGGAANITSTLTVGGSGLFTCRGVNFNTTAELGLDLDASGFVIARIYDSFFNATYQAVALDAYAIRCGDSVNCIMIGGEVNAFFGGTIGSQHTVAPLVLDGAGSAFLVSAVRLVSFSQDDTNHMAIGDHKSSGGSNTGIFLHNCFKDLFNTNAANAAQMSILRSDGVADATELQALGGSARFLNFFPSSEEIIPAYVDSAGAVVATIAGETLTWTGTPDARVHGAAAAQAANIANVLGCNYANFAADKTPSRFSVGGDLGAATVSAANNTGSITNSEVGKGIRLTSADGLTTENIGLANLGGVLTFT